MKINIGILGAGFIGSTLYKAFSLVPNFVVKIHDKIQEKSKNTLNEVANCDVVFVGVPTPMIKNTGECYTGFLERAISDIRFNNKNSIIVIKSTVPPHFTERMNFNFGKIWFSPEFLTEAGAYEDFINLPYQIIGYPNKEEGASSSRDLLQKIFFSAYESGVMKCKTIYSVHSSEAEMCKYVRNCYLATRLSFFQEMKVISDKLDLNFEMVKELACLDERIGNYYNKVESRYGGHCLPKDLNEIKFLFKKYDIEPHVLKGVWDRNLQFPGKNDWEEMNNRAVIDLNKHEQ